MGTRDPEQPPLWIAASDLPVSPGHPFYTRLNALLDANGFDTFVEDACRSFYAPVLGRPSLEPGRYVRLLLVGYFEGIDSERGIGVDVAPVFRRLIAGIGPLLCRVADCVRRTRSASDDRARHEDACDCNRGASCREAVARGPCP